jgi:hypothetical protein
MDAAEPINVFFSAIGRDGRISSVHISIFCALVQHSQRQGFVNPMLTRSYEVMELAKISANSTYHRCIRDLHDYGYIRYEPSYKRTEKSKVYLLSAAGTPF